LTKPAFLVDANLPRNFAFFRSENFLFVADIDLRMSDTDIWNLALSKELVILTRDSDFYSRALVSETKPKVIYFRLGNILLADLNEYFKKNWTTILHALDGHFLIVANKENIDILI